MMNLTIKPPYLKAGDKVIIISTARKITDQEIAPALRVLKNWNLEVLVGEHLYESDNQFAGSDEQRLSDLQYALDNEQVKAVFCARGGYGTPRIIDAVNWTRFRNSPKWIIGFSDVTVLLNKITSFNICSVHGPMPLFFDKEEYASSIDALYKFLFGQLNGIAIDSHGLNRPGAAIGILTGGNLSMIVNSIGTSTAIDPKGAILILEDVDEYLYHIDRMMLHLERSGVLSQLNGLIIGHFSDMTDNVVPFGKDAYNIIKSHVIGYRYPVAFNFPMGHQPRNMPVPVGSPCKLKVGNEEVHLDFS